MVLLTLAASVFLSSNPQAAYADGPQYDPVFYYYHPDHLGSSQLMTDRAGAIVQHYGYTPFGKENYRNNTYAFSLSNRYTGQQLDEETGLYYYGARYYDPELARFIQADSTIPDPEFSQAYNRYAYVYNNPLKFTDPTGQEPFTIAALIMAALKTAVVSACISATVAAITGGDIGKAFISGFIGGFCAVAIGGVIGALAGGALGALATGGDPLQGALSAGVAIGVQVCLGFSPTPSTGDASAGQFLKELALSTASGALCGGVTAELMGGEFSEGAVSGAAAASANYIVSSALEGTPSEGDPQGDDPFPVPAPRSAEEMGYGMNMAPATSGNSWIGVVPDAITYSSSDEGLYMQALFQEQGNITFIARKPVPSLAKQLLHNGGKQAFKSHKAFTRYYGSAGENMHWHHIVEHTGKNVFHLGKESLHNANNMVKIPAKLHGRISAYYSRRLPWMPKGMTVRSWINRFPMDVQYKIGVQIMRMHGVGM